MCSRNAQIRHSAATALGLGFPSELNDWNLLLKATCPLVKGYGEINLALTKSSFPDGWHLLYQKGLCKIWGEKVISRFAQL